MNSISDRQRLPSWRKFVETIGYRTLRGIAELGYVAMLFLESAYWTLWGKRLHQGVRLSAIVQEAMRIGVLAIPIASLLVFTVGIMLAIQGIETLKTFGAQATVVIGIALSITREFSPLIISILVAGRSGSAITARIGSMMESQEIDALRVIGISPIRFLAAPILIAMLVMVPALTVIGDLMGLLGGALYTSMELQMSVANYLQRSLDVLSVDDIRQGLIKAAVFALIIALVGLSNGFQVRGGAEGVGRATTRSVVTSISLIILADMVFTFLMNR
jgi:phospholipid/cholesterol/gamma-HCH transport system permease protein